MAKRCGLRPHYETGLFRTADDYRVPDQLYYRPEQQSERGAEGAELVVEIRSKGDEAYDKIGFYAGLGVREMLIVHPEGRWVELLRAVGDRLLPVSADAQGAVRSEVLGAQFVTVEADHPVSSFTALSELVTRSAAAAGARAGPRRRPHPAT